jgi:hypothetical protein
MLNDVRDYLRKQLEELADSDATPEELELRLKRANATVSVSQAIVATVKTEIDAIKVYYDTGLMPSSVEPPKELEAKPGLRALPGGRRA